MNDEYRLTPGTLYLCATPIGNLGDITYRVVQTLSQADMIAAEDTRNSLKLLNHLNINRPLTSYHEHNKYEKAQKLIDMLKEGSTIALITDAGMPAISDPGEVLVKMCHEQGVPVTSLPGACACVTALSLSGMSARRFCFEGFLPPGKKERDKVLSDLKDEKRTIIMYEAPHHIKKTLSLLGDTLGYERHITLCRELTKLHEEAYISTIQGCMERYEKEDPRGEFVLIIEGLSEEEAQSRSMEIFKDLTLTEHMDIYLSQGLDKKEAMKAVAADLGISKREVYARLENEKNT